MLVGWRIPLVAIAVSTGLAGMSRGGSEPLNILFLISDDQRTDTIAAHVSPEIDLTGRPRQPDRHQPEWIVRKYFSRTP